LGSPADDPSLLKAHSHQHEKPAPDDPGYTPAGTRYLVEGLESRVSGGDTVASQFNLNHNFDHAADENQPEGGKADACPQSRSSNQLSRTDNRSRDNQPRAEHSHDGSK